jgi:hypothetical protein
MTTLVLLFVSLLQGPPAPPTARAQDGKVPARPAAEAPSDEVRTLDIAERRIVEQDFHASRALRLASEDGSGVALDVGAAVDARRIELTLRNVKGLVRYRWSLAALPPRLHVLALPEENQ